MHDSNSFGRDVGRQSVADQFVQFKIPMYVCGLEAVCGKEPPLRLANYYYHAEKVRFLKQNMGSIDKFWGVPNFSAHPRNETRAAPLQATRSASAASTSSPFLQTASVLVRPMAVGVFIQRRLGMRSP